MSNPTRWQKQVSRVAGCIVLGFTVAIASCSAETVSEVREEINQVLPASNSPEVRSQAQAPSQPLPSQQWRRVTPEERSQILDYLLDSPMGIAALNQLAIEGFISPTCPKTFYTYEQSGGFQTMLRVKCPTERGASTARAYDEIRVIFNRFEGNIENFEIERIYPERPARVTLPE